MPNAATHELAFSAIAIVAAYKVACLLVGLLFGYMGYRLFLAGLETSAGDLEASSGERKIKLTRAAPGTFFALFGAAVIAATIAQGFGVDLPNQARSDAGGLPAHPPMVNDETDP